MPPQPWSRLLVLALAAMIVAAACADSPTLPAPTSAVNADVAQDDATFCADVIDVVVSREASGTYRFDVTVRSADTGQEKYADLWEVRAPDGTVLGKRVLTHPHVDEQPFSRSQSGISIPESVTVASVVARDTVAGFCGEAFEVAVP